MVALAGQVAVLVGLAGALALAAAAGWALLRPTLPRRVLVGPAAAVLGGAVAAMAVLVGAMVADRFEVAYVAAHGSRATPLLYKVTGAWSALEGSIVLWALLLAAFLAWTVRQVRSCRDRLGVAAVGVLAVVAVFFLGLLATSASPFGLLADPPADGPGPNALLQNHPLVAIHPPVLYLGYVGWSVPFAFAIAALALGETDDRWLRRAHGVVLATWSFLTAGLVLGALWSYEVLGWGGYWAWDPVENAALLPWLTATALLHTSMVQRRRGELRAWSMALVVATFALTILGTFLTRSSVVSSVHSFTRSAVGPALLGFFLLVVVVGLGLLAVRAPSLASPGRVFWLRSREGALLLNNVLLGVLATAVLVGTLYPVVVQAVTGAQVSVGRPFYDRMAVPVGVALLALMAVGPSTSYRYTDARVLGQRLQVPVLVGSAVAAGLVLLGVRAPSVVVCALLATVGIVASVRRLLAGRGGTRPATALRRLRTQRHHWGGQLAHAGLAVVIVAIAASSALAERATATLDVGGSTTFAGYTLTYTGTDSQDQGYRTVDAARVELRRDGALVHVARPRLHQYPSQVQPVASPDVWTSPGQDVYVSLTALDDAQVSLALFRYPAMWLLWFGGLLTVLGGLWALTGARTRDRRTASGPAGPTGDLAERRAVLVLDGPRAGREGVRDAV